MRNVVTALRFRIPIGSKKTIGVSPTQHSLQEDVAAILLGTSFVAFGTKLFADAHLVTGGIAGVALLLQHSGTFPFWVAFFAVNLPFYLLAWNRLGPAVALRTLLAVSLVSILAGAIHSWVEFSHLDTAFAAIAGGGLCGVGLLILFRHRTGLGGFNLLAWYLQDTIGIRAGYFQMILDLAVLAGAFLVLGAGEILLSVFGAVVLNLVLAMNHRSDRYVAMS
ncbi:YitT family protein [Aquibium sp. LZ166]|uniref:YitT family protein n=1 Tax=Aquibium pacificus TaxID=3153579 RepID=A0ABV3SK78_9HYPH